MVHRNLSKHSHISHFMKQNSQRKKSLVETKTELDRNTGLLSQSNLCSKLGTKQFTSTPQIIESSNSKIRITKKALRILKYIYIKIKIEVCTFRHNKGKDLCPSSRSAATAKTKADNSGQCREVELLSVLVFMSQRPFFLSLLTGMTTQKLYTDKELCEQQRSCSQRNLYLYPSIYLPY